MREGVLTCQLYIYILYGGRGRRAGAHGRRENFKYTLRIVNKAVGGREGARGVSDPHVKCCPEANTGGRRVADLVQVGASADSARHEYRWGPRRVVAFLVPRDPALPLMAARS